MAIGAIGSTAATGAISAPESAGAAKPAASSGGFADQLLDAVDQARALEQNATTQSQKFADGDASVGIHEVVIAAEKANVAVKFAVTLKNKALEAYRDLMNTPV